MSKDNFSQSSLIIFGAALSAAYIVGHAIYLFFVQDNILAMDPNEYGDFLAGLFAPLAFLWLVLGFFQQGKELRLQVKELANSVEQSRELVEVSRKQFLHDIERAEEEIKARRQASRPILRLVQDTSGVSGETEYYHFRLINSGPQCTNVEILDDSNATAKSGFSWHAVLKTGQTVVGKFSFTKIELQDFRVTVNFTDATGYPAWMRFLVEVQTDEYGKKILKPQGLPETASHPELL